MVEADLEPVLQEFMSDVLDDAYGPLDNATPEHLEGVRQAAMARLREVFTLDRMLPENAPLPEREECEKLVHGILDQLKAQAGESYRDILRYFLLEELDRCWKEHLRNMDALRDGIGLRGYGQRDPKLEYKREGFEMFQEMLFQIRESVFRALTRVRVQMVEPEAAPEPAAPEEYQAANQSQDQPLAREFRHRREPAALSYSGGGDALEPKSRPAKAAPRVGRNDPCPCGSGKKYKKCCGRDQ